MLRPDTGEKDHFGGTRYRHGLGETAFGPTSVIGVFLSKIRFLSSDGFVFADCHD
jgi:hypothetical protein